MLATRRKVIIERHEWTLKSPAHHTEIQKAIEVAAHDSEVAGGTDVRVSATDDEVVVWYETKEQAPRTRSESIIRAAARG